MPTLPKNADFALEQQLRKNGFAESGYKQLEPSYVGSYTWNLPALPKVEDLTKVEPQSLHSESKPLFGRVSTSKFTVLREYKEAPTPNKDSEFDMSFAFSPINKAPEIARPSHSKAKLIASNFRGLPTDELAIENLESMDRPVATKRLIYSTDVNQLYTHETLLSLTRNSYFRNNRNKTTVLDELRTKLPGSVLGSIVREMESRR